MLYPKTKVRHDTFLPPIQKNRHTSKQDGIVVRKEFHKHIGLPGIAPSNNAAHISVPMAADEEKASIAKIRTVQPLPPINQTVSVVEQQKVVQQEKPKIRGDAWKNIVFVLG